MTLYHCASTDSTIAKLHLEIIIEVQIIIIWLRRRLVRALVLIWCILTRLIGLGTGRLLSLGLFLGCLYLLAIVVVLFVASFWLFDFSRTLSFIRSPIFFILWLRLLFVFFRARLSISILDVFGSLTKVHANVERNMITTTVAHTEVVWVNVMVVDIVTLLGGVFLVADHTVLDLAALLFGIFIFGFLDFVIVFVPVYFVVLIIILVLLKVQW
jgi:hypothetical protein